MRSISNDGMRDSTHSMRRPFRAGDPTSFTYWIPFKSFNYPTPSVPTASWKAQDELGNLNIVIDEESGSLTSAHFSKRYLQATRIESFSFEIEAPGFLPEWNADLSAPHLRDVFVQDVTATEVKTRAFYEYSDRTRGSVSAASTAIEKAKTRAAKQGRVY